MRPLIIALLIAAGAVASAAERDADHVALRALLAEVTTALDAGDLERLRGSLATTFAITFADAERFTDLAALKAYDQRLRSERKLVKTTFAPVADALTTFLGADAGVCTGTSKDSFAFADGTSTTIDSRWTATVVREQGAWKVAALHSCVNLLDNPLLRGVRDAATRFAAFAALAAAGLGLVLGIALGRRRAR
jgi:hypothetical protein